MATHNFEAMASKLDDPNSGTVPLGPGLLEPSIRCALMLGASMG